MQQVSVDCETSARNFQIIHNLFSVFTVIPTTPELLKRLYILYSFKDNTSPEMQFCDHYKIFIPLGSDSSERTYVFGLSVLVSVCPSELWMRYLLNRLTDFDQTACTSPMVARPSDCLQGQRVEGQGHAIVCTVSHEPMDKMSPTVGRRTYYIFKVRVAQWWPKNSCERDIFWIDAWISTKLCMHIPMFGVTVGPLPSA